MNRLSPLRPLSYSSPLRAASLLTMATVLSACGGGGGSGGSGDSGSRTNAGSSATDDFIEFSASSRAPFVGLPDLTAIDLNDQNAETVVTTVLQAIARAMQLGSNGGGAVGSFEDFLSGSEGADFGFSQFFGTELDGFLQRAAEGFDDGITSIECPVAGEFVLELDVADGDEPDFAAAGLDLRSCDFGNGLLLTGALDVEFNGALGALGAGLEALDRATLSVVADELSFHRSPEAFSTNGLLSAELLPLADGTSLVVVMNFNYANLDEAISWQEFQIEATKEAATEAFSVIVNGFLGANLPDRLDGQVEVETVTAITGVGPNPDAGEIWLHGADDSRLTISIVPGGDVVIELFKGDVKQPLDMLSSWSELQDLAQRDGLAGD